jgi:hypothetical protein
MENLTLAARMLGIKYRDLIERYQKLYLSIHPTPTHTDKEEQTKLRTQRKDLDSRLEVVVSELNALYNKKFDINLGYAHLREMALDDCNMGFLDKDIETSLHKLNDCMKLWIEGKDDEARIMEAQIAVDIRRRAYVLKELENLERERLDWIETIQFLIKFLEEKYCEIDNEIDRLTYLIYSPIPDVGKKRDPILQPILEAVAPLLDA